MANKNNNKGCSTLAYWLFIGWWLWLLKFLFHLANVVFINLSNFLYSIFKKIGANISLTLTKTIVIMSFITICGFCYLGSFIYSKTPAGQAAATNRANTATSEYIKTEINPGLTKTSIGLTPPVTEIPKPTKTPRPTKTRTTVPTDKPTNTAIPVIPTWTLDPNAPCICNYALDCNDFTSQSGAQACFNYCGGSASNNFANLDGSDHDGRVCENLP